MQSIAVIEFYLARKFNEEVNDNLKAFFDNFIYSFKKLFAILKSFKCTNIIKLCL